MSRTSTAPNWPAARIRPATTSTGWCMQPLASHPGAFRVGAPGGQRAPARPHQDSARPLGPAVHHVAHPCPA
jgi:hypothetical protein